MEQLIEEAFRVAILTEKNSYDLYRSAGAMLPEGNGRQILERLAREESKLIEEMMKCCPESMSNMVKLPNDQRLPSQTNFKESPERRLFKQLRIALLDKHACIDRYATFVRTFREPALCRVFELALVMSRKQFALIAEEFRQADLRLHISGASRRVKRIHIREGVLPTPNRHSELFISLLDSGRNPLI